MATVSIQCVSKSFEKYCVLQNLNLKIEKGEFVVIVGPSGCGKSTLLRLIAGLDDMDSGSILINDRCVNKTPAAARDIAMVFQNYALYPHMTVYDNMAYGLKMRKIKKEVIRQRVEEVGEMLHLTDCMQRKPNALSGGQCQRVSMGRAIVRSPAVFLFDEPLSNLDFKLRTEMRHEIKKLHKQLKATCIYVTHDQTEAMTMADRIVVLHQGKIEQVGSPQALYEQPNSTFVASFLGHYPMNFISGTLDLAGFCLHLFEGGKLPFPDIDMENVAQDESIVVGVRSEHLLLVSTHEEGSFAADVESVDFMGSDNLVRLTLQQKDVSICVRVSGEFPLNLKACFVKIDTSKAIVFNAHTGVRMGGWRA